MRKLGIVMLLCGCGTNSNAPAGDASSEGSTQAGETTIATDDFSSATTLSSDGTTSAGPTDTSDESDGSEASTEAPPDEPRVHWFGRYDQSEPSVVRYGWSGAGFSVRFEGTGVRARLDDAAGFHTLVVDGEPSQLATTPGEQLYTLAADLPPGEHVVELHRRTEAFMGETRVLDIEIDGTLLAPSVPMHRIEIVGDSITCGYGNEGADALCPFSADTENHYRTYGAIAARAVGAELSTVAWSGKGAIFNYGDSTDEPLPELYGRAVPTDGASMWSGPDDADVVVINLGTNDFSTDGDPSQEQFVGAYVDLLTAVRERHPDAAILCTIAPLLGGADLQTALGYIDQAIATRAAEGDDAIERIDLVVEPNGWGCDYHPSAATHQDMADVLIPILQQRL